MPDLDAHKKKAREEFDGSYGDFFTETPDCPGCKKQHEGDTRHRRHCIVNVHDFLDAAIEAAYAAGKEEAIGRVREIVNGFAEEYVNDDQAVALANRDAILSRLDELQGEGSACCNLCWSATGQTYDKSLPPREVVVCRNILCECHRSGGEGV